MVKIVYFAWVRDAVGFGEEDFSMPCEVTTVAELATVLAKRSSGHAEAFADPGRLRVAVDLVMGDFNTAVAGASEIAFFPPVTGG